MFLGYDYSIIVAMKRQHKQILDSDKQKRCFSVQVFIENCITLCLLINNDIDDADDEDEDGDFESYDAHIHNDDTYAETDNDEDSDADDDNDIDDDNNADYV